MPILHDVVICALPGKELVVMSRDENVLRCFI